MADAEIYMALDTYMDYPAPNTPTPVRARQTARAGHPIIKRTPSMWVPIQVDYELEYRPGREQPQPKTGSRKPSGV